MTCIMPKKSYDLTEITRLLLEMRKNCIPKAGNAYEDPNRAEKYDALNAAIDLINNPSLLNETPTLDYAPVRHGEWILRAVTPRTTIIDEAVTCRSCGSSFHRIKGTWFKHCPECGAKMDGGKDDG